MFRNIEFPEEFDKYRFNNLSLKSIVIIFVILKTAGIYWKKKRLTNNIENHQRNVLTLKQTLGLLFLIYCSNVLSDYTLSLFKPTDLVFFLEELRVLLVENLLIKFTIPIVLILNTKKHLPGLWTNREIKRSEFFMTRLNFDSFITVNDGENRTTVMINVTEAEPEVQLNNLSNLTIYKDMIVEDIRRPPVSQMPEIEI